MGKTPKKVAKKPESKLCKKQIERLSKAFKDGYITRDELDSEIAAVLEMSLPEEDKELAEMWEKERRQCQK